MFCLVFLVLNYKPNQTLIVNTYMCSIALPYSKNHVCKNHAYCNLSVRFLSNSDNKQKQPNQSHNLLGGGTVTIKIQCVFMCRWNAPFTPVWEMFTEVYTVPRCFRKLCPVILEDLLLHSKSVWQQHHPLNEGTEHYRKKATTKDMKHMRYDDTAGDIKHNADTDGYLVTLVWRRQVFNGVWPPTHYGHPK